MLFFVGSFFLWLYIIFLLVRANTHNPTTSDMVFSKIHENCLKETRNPKLEIEYGADFKYPLSAVPN